ncbi:MAG: DUF3299 domain-containing protein [Pseudomonadota bacterium]
MKRLSVIAALLGVLPVVTGVSIGVLASDDGYAPVDGEITGRNDGLLILDWTDLLPPGEEERLIKIYEDFYSGLGGGLGGSMSAITEGSALDMMPQLGTFSTVDDLDGKRVELPGFVVPLDFQGRAHASFLIVPYFGACIHTPPPAPNQIVYATAEPAQELGNIFYPLWFKGVLETSRYDTDLGNAAYTLRLESVRPYE